MNEYQEALTNLKTYIVDYDDEFVADIYLYESYKEEFDLLQKLVDKATPKKPTRYMSKGYIERERCPNCKSFLKDGEYKYCDQCGQALDWSDE